MSLFAQFFVSVAAVISGMGPTLATGDQHGATRRPPTVADSIEMSLFGEANAEFLSDPDAVKVSTDGKWFVVVVRRGNLSTDTNDYSLLLYSTADALKGQSARVLAVFRTSSNRPGIGDVRWASDGRSVLFIGARGDEKRQLYFVAVPSGKLRQLTHQTTDVVGFDASNDLRTVVLEALPPARDYFSGAARGKGIVVSHQMISDLLIGQTSGGYGLDVVSLNPPNLFVSRHDQKVEQIKQATNLSQDISVSPDGQRAVVMRFVFAKDAPPQWQYKDLLGAARISVYSIVDLTSGVVRPLLDAPARGDVDGIPIAWAADGRSVIVDTFLPLNIDDSSEREERQSNPFRVEVDLDTGAITKIAPGACTMRAWDARSKTAVFGGPHNRSSRSDPSERCREPRAYRQVSGRWEQIDLTAANSPPSTRVAIVQDMNTPPKLSVWDPGASKMVTVLDPNPRFRELQFSHVEEITLKDAKGETYTGGFYPPFGVAPGVKAPLVIQTHDWNPHRFEMDGYSSAGYAAQELAGAGIAVVQLPFAPHSIGDSREGPMNAAMHENVIDELSARGLIDRERVGIQGWSRTGYGVRYTLSFSRYPIVAALVADGWEGGYVQYMLYTPQDIERGSHTSEVMNGGRPFGEGLQAWLKNSPMFNLDKVHTPELLFALGRYSFTNMWESFAGLERLNRPVEMIYLPDSNHWPIRPSERMTVQQSAVDWFRFWLQGFEDASPGKAPQYRRWEILCDKQINDAPSRMSFCVSSKRP